MRAAERLVLVLVAMAVLGGCAAPHRQPPDFDVRFDEVETITLIPPKIAVYSINAGNVEEEVQAWTDEAHRHVVAAVEKEVAELGRVFVPYAGDGLGAVRLRVDGRSALSPRFDEPTEALDSWLLFEAVNLAVMRHTYHPLHTFKGRIEGFDYTLGPQGAALLGETDADAFLLVIATDHIPTRDRQALIAAGLLVGAMTMSYGGPGTTPAALTLALIESRSGDLLWYNRLEMPLSDLRDEGTDAVLVDLVMKGLTP